jgi:cell division septum initiation protein DivIVA
MDREQIIRDDFPTARKGWSPEAVRLHLVAVAEAFPAADHDDRPTPVADAASEHVHSVIAAAEAAAGEILAEARVEAERIRSAARNESEQTVTAANREATGRVEQARGAVEGLIAQADKLRNQVGALGKDLASNMPGSASSSEAEPAVVPDVASEPVRREDSQVAEDPSNEDLISQLRGSAVEAEAPAEPVPSESAGSGADHGAARLVAMNMALEGATRDEISERIETEFGEVEGIEGLVDDVLRRAGR